ncbi:aminotransferase class IV family protein [Hoylesella pleuritidis]|jgi:hypothetical protein|uniref:aminotransferase class IV family protein n=1 Tax=Hoylesella pleuritidis TaxID=407975 RepID=UPI0028E7AB19|nr:aminotransferase class IV family protein [Hoylesella pleuritidis]
MCPFIETLAVVAGRVRHLSYHEQRLNATRRHFWPEAKDISLASVLSDAPSADGLFKARLIYNEHGVITKTYLPYTMRQISSLRLVCADDVDYSFKSTDRTYLNQLFAQRGTCDDILIIKNGLVTDTSFTNIALFDGYHWFTPDTPLLPGTMRAWLLDRGFVTTRRIAANDLSHFHSVALINALIGLGQCVVPVAQIRE